MRLCEKLVRNSALSPSERARLLQAQRVVADEVAAYYYLGTDQEYWSLTRDFPNLAPPFESFFIECRAPEAIVSRETGITRWTPEMGYEWGHLFLTTSRRQRIEALCEEEGRQRLWQETHDERERLLVTLRDWQSNVLPQEGRHPLQDQSGFSPSLVQAYVERARRLLDALGAGRRDEAQRVLESDPWEWSLELLTYVNFSRSERHLTGPLWWTRLRILPTGEVETDVQGNAIWEDEPLGWVNQSLQLLRRREGFAAYARAVQEARLSIAPLIDTALLTICFLHCRNVVLQEVRPSRKPLSNQQRRRGERPRVPLSYHVLDIRPMREVLRQEGQEERMGARRALHICRGHFAHYEERGLFGKYKGTFWRPQHVRGSAERVQLKDYRLSLPGQDPRVPRRPGKERRP